MGEFKLTQTVEGKVGFYIFKPIIYLKSNEKFQFEKIAGVTLIELMIGILVTSLMMGAMFTTYRVVQGSYQQVTDKAKVSRSSRDVVGMIIKDIRLAGFKYYHGENDKNIPVFDDLSQIIGFGDAEEADGTVRKCSDSHAPIIIFRNTTDYVPNQLDRINQVDVIQILTIQSQLLEEPIILLMLETYVVT